MALDELEGRQRVEPAHQQDRGPSHQAQPENDVQPEDVEQRVDTQVHVVAADRPPGVALHLLEVGQQVAVGQHGRLGRARRPGGEQQYGQVAGVAVDHGRSGVRTRLRGGGGGGGGQGGGGPEVADRS